MSVFLVIAVSLLLLLAGYGYLCALFAGNEGKLPDPKSLKPSRNKILYLVCAILISASLYYVLGVLYHQTTMSLIKAECLLLVIAPAAAVDFRFERIPNLLILTGISLRAVLLIAEGFSEPAQILGILKDALIGALVIGLFFGVIGVVFKGSIGMGDLKLFIVMGLFQGLWGAVTSVFFSLAVSFVAAIVLLISRRKKRSDSIPFGPCILIGTWAAVLLTGM